jgi:hypothetical protein
MVSPRRLSAALLLGGLLAVPGCGTSVVQHDSRYQAALGAVQQRFASSVTAILAGTSPHSGRAATTSAVGAYESALAQVELRLRAIRAPATVSRLHRHLVQTIARYGAEVRRMVAALGNPSAAARTAGARRFRAATVLVRDDVQSTVARIEQTLRREPGGANP